ncbi:hypothetical protein BJX61DRAFT_123009 [Aspergillus egyptiacus]|nr:hypothetical protein BJX61DRAFT_123009 [Aspergillus egyptiacus]
MDQTPSDRLSSHLDALRPSSSASPRQRWTQLPPFVPSPITETATSSSHQVNPCRYEHAIDESTRAHRTTALRHLNGLPKHTSWKTRQPASHSASKSSSFPSQPVLVRSYSGPDDTSAPSMMPTRRSFLFPGITSFQRREPELPSDEEFSIDGILRAIEPNIRSTLDSIGEICGRSRLSLANEYGSHMPPLGEIRAPPGGLLPVEEACSVHEYSGDNVVIYDDEAAEGRDHTPFSSYTFFDALLPPITAPAPSGQSQSDELALEALPTTREFASKPKAGGRALLASTEPEVDGKVQNILTPALVSEILLDAQANGCLSKSDLSDLARAAGSRCIYRGKTPEVKSLFRWLKQAAWGDGTEAGQETAESRLRAMLGQQNEQTSTS